MDNIIKQLKKGAKHTRLSVDEKAVMKTALLRYVGAHPVNSGLSNRQRIPSPFNINNFRNKKSLSFLVIGGLLMGGSMSFAAENTVPGDTLYSVKVHVNEAVRGVVAVTPKAKARWDVRLVERRLEEVEKIATMPSVLPEVQQIAQTNLEHYTDRVNKRIARFEEDDDSDDAILTAGELADMFRTHEEALAEVSAQGAVGTATSTTIAVATTTNPVDTIVSTKTQSLESVITKLRAGRGNAEKKHKELKSKYHREDDDKSDVDNDSDRDEGKKETTLRFDSAQMNVAVSVATTTQISVQKIKPFDRNKKSNKEKDKDEEFRSAGKVEIPVSTITATTTRHIEFRTEISKENESADSRDDDSD